MSAPLLLASAPSAAGGAPAVGPTPIGATATTPDLDHRHESLPHQNQAACIARRAVCTTLAEWGVDGGTVDDILLVVSELVTNAVQHAAPPLTLSLLRSSEDAVRVEVCSGGCAPSPVLRSADDEPEEHGRGLTIVAALATVHGIRHQDGETICWAEFSGAAAGLSQAA
ncbi:ATP-binding protein [Streptomyces sp. NPDC102259]|uniref:ATP-binding protein n=1 Tax=Streptomyces sp. NPDC102259 TaxID=3366148 RepID=UPI0037F28331